MEKKIKIIGDIEVGGERGRVMDRGGAAVSMTSTDYKDPAKVIKIYRSSYFLRSYKSLNSYNGVCRTIKSQYWKNSIDNFTCDGTFGATGVIRKIETNRNNRADG